VITKYGDAGVSVAFQADMLHGLERGIVRWDHLLRHLDDRTDGTALVRLMQLVTASVLRVTGGT
jgi:hypothetical protein